MERADKLEWLEWFYTEADFGPADGDVRDGLKRRFKAATGMALPEGYSDPDEPEDATAA